MPPLAASSPRSSPVWATLRATRFVRFWQYTLRSGSGQSTNIFLLLVSTGPPAYLQVRWSALRPGLPCPALRYRLRQGLRKGYRQGHHARNCWQVCKTKLLQEVQNTERLTWTPSLIGIGEIVLLPLDVLKIKRQTNPEAFRGRGLFKIISDEGMGLYRGAGWTAARNAPGSFAVSLRSTSI